MLGISMGLFALAIIIALIAITVFVNTVMIPQSGSYFRALTISLPKFNTWENGYYPFVTNTSTTSSDSPIPSSLLLSIYRTLYPIALLMLFAAAMLTYILLYINSDINTFMRSLINNMPNFFIGIVLIITFPLIWDLIAGGIEYLSYYIADPSNPSPQGYDNKVTYVFSQVAGLNTGLDRSKFDPTCSVNFDWDALRNLFSFNINVNVPSSSGGGGGGSNNGSSNSGGSEGGNGNGNGGGGGGEGNGSNSGGGSGSNNGGGGGPRRGPAIPMFLLPMLKKMPIMTAYFITVNCPILNLITDFNEQAQTTFVDVFMAGFKTMTALLTLLLIHILGYIRIIFTAMLMVALPLLLALSFIPFVRNFTSSLLLWLVGLVMIPFFSSLIITTGVAYYESVKDTLSPLQIWVLMLVILAFSVFMPVIIVPALGFLSGKLIGFAGLGILAGTTAGATVLTAGAGGVAGVASAMYSSLASSAGGPVPLRAFASHALQLGSLKEFLRGGLYGIEKGIMHVATRDIRTALHVEHLDSGIAGLRDVFTNVKDDLKNVLRDHPEKASDKGDKGKDIDKNK